MNGGWAAIAVVAGGLWSGLLVELGRWDGRKQERQIWEQREKLGRP